VGLLKHLLFWPVTGPSFLTRFSLAKVEGAVRTELTDDQVVKRELMELQMALELGDIDDDEYVRREAELMHRLREVRRWREAYGMATAGGPVRVADSGGETDGGEAGDDGAGDAEGTGSPDDRTPRVAGGGPAEIEISFDPDPD
jgi:hypothetical protein